MIHLDPKTCTSGALFVERNAAKSRRKRALDIMISLFALALFLPLMLAIAAIIRLESAGPALFRQRRGGLNNEPFVILKFRTMRTLDDGEVVRQATLGDQRVTPFGALLRRTSVDELPQFINVLCGDMSIVGPRPHALAHDAHYSEVLPDYRHRWAVKPGLTGMAQVSGLRGETVKLEAMAARINCDLEYIRRWSFLLDLKLILFTAKVPFDQRAAY
jgi:putative colanic acid biosysnthesis UDP-glucose lipid carrier transferase